jgi:hypothetical protein
MLQFHWLTATCSKEGTTKKKAGHTKVFIFQELLDRFAAASLKINRCEINVR